MTSATVVTDALGDRSAVDITGIETSVDTGNTDSRDNTDSDTSDSDTDSDGESQFVGISIDNLPQVLDKLFYGDDEETSFELRDAKAAAKACKKLWFGGDHEDDIKRLFKPEHLLQLARLFRRDVLWMPDRRLFRHITVGFCQMVEMQERLCLVGMNMERMYQAMGEEVYCNTIELVGSREYDDLSLYWELIEPEKRAERLKDLQPSRLNNGGGEMVQTD